jgi:hypothetical protein
MDSISNDTTFDQNYGPHSPYDTLPLRTEVERAFNAHPGGDVKAWFDKHGIEAEPIGKVIQYDLVWNPETGRYQFNTDGPHTALAVPIIEGGKFVDLILIHDDMSFDRVTCRASWLGTITPTTRLHVHPLDWIEAGHGACHIEPIGRKALKDLRAATTIECSCIETALQAWDWGFGGEDDELACFSIDDTPDGIRSYLETDIRWRTASKESQA